MKHSLASTGTGDAKSSTYPDKRLHTYVHYEWNLIGLPHWLQLIKLVNQ